MKHTTGLYEKGVLIFKPQIPNPNEIPMTKFFKRTSVVNRKLPIANRRENYDLRFAVYRENFNRWQKTEVARKEIEKDFT